MSNCAIWERDCPLTLVKLPTATSWVLPGLLEICRTLVRSVGVVVDVAVRARDDTGEVAVLRSGRGVDGAERLLGHSGDVGELPGQPEPVADDLEVADVPADGPWPERRVTVPGRNVGLEQAARHRDAVRRAEPATDVDRRTVRGGLHLVDDVVGVGVEVGADRPGRRVEREDPVARHDRAGGGLADLREVAPDDHHVADLDDRVDRAVQDVRGEVRGILVHDLPGLRVAVPDRRSHRGMDGDQRRQHGRDDHDDECWNLAHDCPPR